MTAQERIDEVTNSPRNTRVALVQRLNAPASLLALASVHPAICVLPEEQRRAAAMRLLKIAYTSATKNAELLKCSPDSIVAGVVEAAQLGLSVDGVQGHAYLVPYFSRGQMLAQMQIGYRGYIALAYRSDRVERMAADVVCEADEFEYEEGSSPRLRHVIPLGDVDRGKVIGAYALARLREARDPIMRVLSLRDIFQRRNSSKAWQAFEANKIKSTPWADHFDAMARKTAVRAVAPLLPSEWAQRAEALESARDVGASDPPAAVSDVIDAELEPEGA